MNDEQDAFLREANVAIFGSVDAKGRPHSTPVWYLYDGGDIIVSVGRGSQKHINAERNPNVSLVVDDRKVPYYAVMVQGMAAIGEPLDDDQRLRLATRYLGEEIGKRYVEATEGNDSVTLRITPRKVIDYSGRAGRQR